MSTFKRVQAGQYRREDGTEIRKETGLAKQWAAYGPTGEPIRREDRSPVGGDTLKEAKDDLAAHEADQAPAAAGPVAPVEEQTDDVLRDAAADILAEQLEEIRRIREAWQVAGGLNGCRVHVEREVKYWPPQIGAGPRMIVQRGTVTEVGAACVRVEWAEAAGVAEEVPIEDVRLVRHEDLARERRAFGWAVGDLVRRGPLADDQAPGVVVEGRKANNVNSRSVRVHWLEGTCVGRSSWTESMGIRHANNYGGDWTMMGGRLVQHPSPEEGSRREEKYAVLRDQWAGHQGAPDADLARQVEADTKAGDPQFVVQATPEVRKNETIAAYGVNLWKLTTAEGFAYHLRWRSPGQVPTAPEPWSAVLAKPVTPVGTDLHLVGLLATVRADSENRAQRAHKVAAERRRAERNAQMEADANTPVPTGGDPDPLVGRVRITADGPDFGGRAPVELGTVGHLIARHAHHGLLGVSEGTFAVYMARHQEYLAELVDALPLDELTPTAVAAAVGTLVVEHKVSKKAAVQAPLLLARISARVTGQGLYETDPVNGFRALLGF
ncbi:hypothetical protein ACFC1T_09140 [Kitasatospora sp. NPDC056076]|uniref:hypothetical protein n=1 Tax=Kitasatospora sp. NPDC056076 TaxID=3345703 RepID=UPI0035DB00AF